MGPHEVPESLEPMQYISFFTGEVRETEKED